MIKLIRFVVVYELRLWAALYRWVFRRPVPIEPGAQRFTYHRAVNLILGVLLVVSAIEVPILHLIVPWEPVRLAALAIGVYGLVWMVGLLATMHVHQHLVGPSGLRIRNSLTLDLPLRWDQIAAIDVRRRSMPPGGQTQLEDGVLSLGMASQTSVDIRLTEPLTVPVRKTRGESVSQIRFHADEPEALVAAARPPPPQPRSPVTPPPPARPYVPAATLAQPARPSLPALSLAQSAGVGVPALSLAQSAGVGVPALSLAQFAEVGVPALSLAQSARRGIPGISGGQSVRAGVTAPPSVAGASLVGTAVLR
ncbi:hypothetical protein BJY16_008053 [Actinoplanes octamycinicus]|uniref:PH domain-containing protein n=1 Tax=Actinoplanes octamycinicus TaxID=135948 RepID=A0A7W7H648_9ACTN|nr:hypothetical protein [Actinoplanes octamycinicus]MBB4744594.1 hypothetical protein [Actinoplanes octamycinicus]GIE63825.1 hypothetical protein Aoc01nite_92270 [Actinoplanes octamycinicus]